MRARSATLCGPRSAIIWKSRQSSLAIHLKECRNSSLVKRPSVDNFSGLKPSTEAVDCPRKRTVLEEHSLCDPGPTGGLRAKVCGDACWRRKRIADVGISNDNADGKSAHRKSKVP